MLPVREELEKLLLPVALAAFALAFAAGILATLAVSWQDLTRGVSLLSSAAFDRGLIVSVLAGVLAGAGVAVFLLGPAARMTRALEAARRMAEGDLAARAPQSE